MTDIENYDCSLQYVFLIDNTGAVLTCDESGRDFLSKIDLGIFYAQIHSIKINAAITNTTIIIGTTSYNLRLVPIVSNKDFINSYDYNQTTKINPCEYIVVLQNQASFAHIYKKLNQINLVGDIKSREDLIKANGDVYDILEKQNCGIFITNFKGDVVFANRIYENTTGIRREDVIGRSLSDLKSEGVLNPLITPSILKTGEILTTLQKLGTGKTAIISGTPLYDYEGDPILIITAVNTIDSIGSQLSPNHLHELEHVIKNINRRGESHSIDIIAESNAMKTIVQEAIKVARHDVSVLILGESGVGKEVISTIIHTSSKRSARPYVKLNCSAISPSLLESELFGYEPGSFTGASTKGKKGLFEVAEDGTILLDEIGDMPLDLQSKLLRILQDKVAYRVGGITPIKISARILASTNKDIYMLLAEGLFREDLYYRLNVVSLEIPPLRHRKEDIRPLLLHFCYIFNKKYHTNKILSEDLLLILEKYEWPGNIRELQHLLERLFVLCLDPILKPEHFHHRYHRKMIEKKNSTSVSIEEIMPLKKAVAEVEKILVQKALEKAGSTRLAANMLEVSQSTIMRKIKDYDINTV